MKNRSSYLYILWLHVHSPQTAVKSEITRDLSCFRDKRALNFSTLFRPRAAPGGAQDPRPCPAYIDSIYFPLSICVMPAHKKLPHGGSIRSTSRPFRELLHDAAGEKAPANCSARRLALPTGYAGCITLPWEAAKKLLTEMLRKDQKKCCELNLIYKLK